MAFSQSSFPQNGYRNRSKSSSHRKRSSYGSTPRYGSGFNASLVSTNPKVQTPKYDQFGRFKGLSPEMQHIISMVKSVEHRYNEETEPIFSSREDILLHFKEFLMNNICTKQQLFDAMGISMEEFQSFCRKGSNPVHLSAYHWFEKLRIAYNMGKTEKRLRNERMFPNGFPLSNKHGYDMRELFKLYGDRCHFCGEEGHWKDDCTKKKKTKKEEKLNGPKPIWNDPDDDDRYESEEKDETGCFPEDSKKGTKPKDLKKHFLHQQYGNDCFKCGGTGHWAAECPE